MRDFILWPFSAVIFSVLFFNFIYFFVFSGCSYQMSPKENPVLPEVSQRRILLMKIRNN